MIIQSLGNYPHPRLSRVPFELKTGTDVYRYGPDSNPTST